LTGFPSPGGLFLPLSPLLERIPFAPDLAALDGLNATAFAQTRRGLPLRFVPPQDDDLGYEARIWARGEVETRPDNWHDFFNALVWLTFPQSKATLNHRHIQEGAGRQVVRGRGRDAMTHFDECGVVVLSADASLLELVRNFHWKTLFWERRADLAGALRCFIFGHATYEQLLSPFRGLTAKAVLYDVAEDWLRQPLPLQLADLDRRLAGELAAGAYADPRDLHPLPLMGFPGVTAENENAAYYDDTWQFRAGRQQKDSGRNL
jgi:hypothetical protein